MTGRTPPPVCRPRTGFAVVAGHVVLPALVAAPHLVGAATTDPVALLRLGGRLAGLLGLSTMLVAGVLSIRIPGLDRPFGGLTRMWRLHHYLGGASLILLMLHVVMLALAAAAASSPAALAWLLPRDGGLAVWLGWLALVGMMVFLAPSFQFFGRPAYQGWKRLHRLAAPVAVLGLAHALMLDRSLGAPGAALVWGGMGLAATAAFAWRFAVSPRRARRGTIVAHTPLAEGVVEITIADLDRPLAFEAGQFVYFSHEDPALPFAGEEHPFTLSSAPEADTLRIGIKDAGDATRAMQALRPGTRVRLDGPYGDFFCLPDAAPQLWIAGGIGIAPFIGRARSLAVRRPAGLDVHLVYCCENETRSYYHAELATIAADLAGFAVTLHLYEREGFLDLEFLRRACPDALNRAAFVCGPPGLMTHARRLLLGAGLPRHRFHTEEFDLL